ncbi:hypothetical protein [Flavobacterium psychrophilum]|uniref:hypothetical protein n=1 Tax=Flavobacterium psychrophilum TaxID=96345 RepID=UPI000B7C3600|nr:hypothetical protein [Flavobacterium psychrophilum]EKT4502366.1 hypothetical protein [Flavobacterium psychrophilum]MCB5984635.1 hypothetical protein [Flavobacterium psychrophilum]MCB5995530.1 hypothetical protein [Flavobacterium psychrophilum]MCB5997968.1 hypothetical protein [Flavobacterium psychrophilum]MCB6005431.1 hypothetical protein [Flavobacterium psychrophilum]
MSKASRFKNDRLFQFRNSFKYGGSDYIESLYYLIKDVEYNNEDQVIKVVIIIIVDLQCYLNLKEHHKIEKIFENSIPKEVLMNAEVWEMLL